MIQNKDIPVDFLNIRQVWLRQIDRCNDAISRRYLTDLQDHCSEMAGVQLVVESIHALHISLIDWGDAPIKSDVDRWVETVYHKQSKKEQELLLKWAKLKFGFILERLNRYGLLYDSAPKGYSNVSMKSVE